MEQEHKDGNKKIRWEQAALINLLDQGIREGEIWDGRLRRCLELAKVEPEKIEQIYMELKARNVRVIEGVPEPVYTLEQRQTVWQHLEQLGIELSERELLILKLRFEEGLDLTETAQRMGLTRERVRQIESKAMRRITRRNITRRKKIQEFYE